MAKRLFSMVEKEEYFCKREKLSSGRDFNTSNRSCLKEDNKSICESKNVYEDVFENLKDRFRLLWDDISISPKLRLKAYEEVAREKDNTIIRPLEIRSEGLEGRINLNLLDLPSVPTHPPVVRTSNSVSNSDNVNGETTEDADDVEWKENINKRLDKLSGLTRAERLMKQKHKYCTYICNDECPASG